MKRHATALEESYHRIKDALHPLSVAEAGICTHA